MAPLVLAAVLLGLAPGVAPASAGELRVWAQPAGQGSVARTLMGGAAGSLCRDCFVVQHWDGTTWQPQAFSINPRNSYDLGGVAATSPRNAWAVGSYTTDFGGNPMDHTWIEHWDGTTWTRVPSQSSPLAAVTATSPANAWAVGSGQRN